jgi:spore coat protein CotH
MIQSKRINIVVAISMVFALITVTVMFVAGNIATESGANKSEPTYATQVFGTDIISIEIIADESDWQEMLDNARMEQFIMADVIVNGTKFQNVGVRPKGNSSLTQVANSESDRYSFRLQFDEYIKDQTCFGLKSFVINNMLSDNTYMKEYISYDLMKEAGVDTPYFGFADINVNGEAWGLYLAVELYNESYEQRVFGDTSGMLYNVKSMDIGGSNENGDNQKVQDNNGQENTDGMGQRPKRNQENQTNGENTNRTQQLNPNAQAGGEMRPGNFSQQSNGEAQLPDINGGGREGDMGGRGPRGNTGGSLAYIDDNTKSYSAIFNNVVGKGKESDYQRVIEALKALSEGQDIEKYFDVDQILRYLAAHTIVVNLDSYSSNMAQNYYIYENDGQITILPWDYNMSWGGFQSGDASSVINFPIDTPVSGVEMSARPLLEKLFTNTKYLEHYHSYLQQLIDGYFADGKFEAKINELDAIISDYVRNDATAFCTYEDYKKAVLAFITLGNLRAESVQGQLDGTVPSTTAEQTASPEKLILASELNISALGSMGGGRNRGGDEQGGGQVVFPGGGDNMPDRQVMRQVMQIIKEAGGEFTDEEKAKLVELGLTQEQIEQLSIMGNGFPGGGGMEQGNNQNMRPKQNGAPNFSANQSAYSTNNLIFTVVLVAGLLAVTFITAKLKRKY